MLVGAVRNFNYDQDNLQIVKLSDDPFFMFFLPLFLPPCLFPWCGGMLRGAPQLADLQNDLFWPEDSIPPPLDSVSQVCKERHRLLNCESVKGRHRWPLAPTTQSRITPISVPPHRFTMTTAPAAGESIANWNSYGYHHVARRPEGLISLIVEDQP